MKKWFLIFSFLFCLGSLAQAEEPFELDRDAWEDLKSTEDYGDFEAREKLEFETDSESSNRTVRNWEYWGLGISIAIICLVIFFLIRSQKGQERSIGNRGVRHQAKSIEEAEENLPEIALNNLLEELKDNSDYRSALRVKFLMLLQALIDKKLVEWAREKTNSTYQKELLKWTYSQEFEKICLTFDRIWYGHADITELGFQENDQQIQSLIEKLTIQNGQD